MTRIGLVEPALAVAADGGRRGVFRDNAAADVAPLLGGRGDDGLAAIREQQRRP
jgi:hypothetical protein